LNVQPSRLGESLLPTVTLFAGKHQGVSPAHHFLARVVPVDAVIASFSAPFRTKVSSMGLRLPFKPYGVLFPEEQVP
jgi:hypothetical protein